uniref:Uncharacterized protein n=1 Tax=Rhizophora mucronata TaxID=61149 RepID=A0A2P2PSX4_RHIMU
MNTVLYPTKLSFEIGPYFFILFFNHSSAVFLRMALWRANVWPIMGKPKDPGGSFLGFSFLFRRTSRTSGRRKRRIRKEK